MKIIGITGGVGCGKSLVLSYLENKFGAVIVETDKLAHELQKPGEICYSKIVDEFGSGILDNNGIINRMNLGRIVFADEAKLKRLNEIVHPEVLLRLKEMIAREKSDKLFVIESAILFESGLDKLCDETWYIYVEESVRRQRLRESRGYSEEKIDSIMSSQMSEKFFREKCNIIIDNSNGAESTFKQIREEL